MSPLTTESTEVEAAVAAVERAAAAALDGMVPRDGDREPASGPGRGFRSEWRGGVPTGANVARDGTVTRDGDGKAARGPRGVPRPDGGGGMVTGAGKPTPVSLRDHRPGRGRDAPGDAMATVAGTEDAPSPRVPATDGYRERWRALAALGVLGGDTPTVDTTEAPAHSPATAPTSGSATDPTTAPHPPRDSAPAPDRLGPVTRVVATIEGLGRAGVAPGLCYAVASQRFGLQFPLGALLPDRAPDLLRGVTSGEVLLCHALTEEDGGSDPLSMTTRAEPHPDGGYLLTGRKMFVTAAPVADLALVFARTAEGRHPFALSPFLVDLHAPGVVRGDPLPKTALVDVPMGVLEFHGVRLGADRLVGEEGSGLAILASTTAWERALLLSYALGPMRRALDRTVAWARAREHFGRRMGESHLVAARVADMALALFRCRRLVYRAAERVDAGVAPGRTALEAALTKISAADDYLAFTRTAATLGGVRSFIAESGLTTELADPMAAATYAGPNDLLRVSVARGLGLPVET